MPKREPTAEELTKKRRQQGHRERLRQIADKDRDLVTFSDIGILELVLSFLIPRKDTKGIAQDLIESFGSLYGVVHESPGALASVKNMTGTAAQFLQLLPAVTRRIEASRLHSDTYITNTDRALGQLMAEYRLRGEEVCTVVCLDVKDRVLHSGIVSSGTATAVALNIRDIIRRADAPGVVRVILGHNHPSDEVLPSDADIMTTVHVMQTLDMMDIELVDHVVIGQNKYLSMRNSGYLKPICELCNRWRAMLSVQGKPVFGDSADNIVRTYEPIDYSVPALQYFPYKDEHDVLRAKPAEEFAPVGMTGYARRPQSVDGDIYRMIVREVSQDETLKHIAQQIRDLGAKKDD